MKNLIISNWIFFLFAKSPSSPYPESDTHYIYIIIKIVLNTKNEYTTKNERTTIKREGNFLSGRHAVGTTIAVN